MTNKALTFLLLIFVPFSSSILVEEHHWDLPQSQRYGIQQQTLAGGRYITSTNVQDILDLSRDLAAFDNAQDAAEIDRIYREGRSVGRNGSDRITLASIALNRTGAMADTPTFAIYKYAFEVLGKSVGDQNGDFMGRPSQNFADTIVSGLLARQDFSKEVVKEAVLVFHMWLSATFELNNVWTECQANHNSTTAMAALDRVAAFWFGDGENGESLSKLTDLVSREAFGQVGEEVWANTQIFNSLEFLKVFLEDGSSCVGNNGGKSEFREGVDRIHSSMSIPLVQNLIRNMFSTENESITRVYTDAVQAQVMACDPQKADALRIDDVPSMTDEQKVAWAEEVQGALSCMRLDCEDIGTYTRSFTYPVCNASSKVALAGYEPYSVDAKYFSYVDRDLERLHVLLNQGAYSSAQDLYTQGYHAPFSLQALATNGVIPSRIGSKRESLQNNSATDQEIQRALSFQSEFRGLSSVELSSVVLGLLSYQASHDSILSAFEAAMASCHENQGGSSFQSVEFWDIGAALYIGSLEGPLKGGSTKGRLLYGASKDFCQAFDSCVGRNSKINELVIKSFTIGKRFQTNGDCQSLGHLTQNVMIPALQTVLLQGSLYFGSRATILEGSSQDSTLGFTHAFGRSILPQVRASNEESGTVLQDVLLIPNQRAQSVDAFFDATEALQIALRNMTSDCDQIGTLQLFNLSLCDNIENQRPVDNLVFGRYAFGDRKQANQLSSVALDIRDMNRASSIKKSMEIYENGLNVAGEVEWLRGSKLSLSALSRVAATLMSQDHLFNIYKFALYDIHDFEEGSSENFTFADDFILKSAVNATDKDVIAQACIALNIWMMVSHHLQQAIRMCTAQEMSSSDIDAAVALWIGKDQVQGSFTHGWSLYSLSQKAAQLFGAPEGEAIANTQILKIFNSSQTISNTCLDDPFAHYQLRAQVLEALRLLSIPLVQLLLAATASEHHGMISLFATSVLPQFAGCNPTMYKDLSGVLLEDFNTTRVDQGFVEKMTAFLDCIGVSCSDLAITDLAPPTLQTLIGTLCSSTSISSRSDFQDPAYASASLIGRDILQVGALVLTRANWAAIDLYQYGRNARNLSNNISLWTNDGDMGGVLTLRQLATLQARSPIEGLKAFDEFYGSPDYPNELATQVIQGKGLYRNESLTVLANDSVSILEVVVGFQGVVWFLEQTTSACIDSDYEAASQYWELATELFNGATGSFSLRWLSNQICESFGTCMDDRQAASVLGKSIDELMGIAYAWIDEANCDKVDHILTSEIMPLLKAILLQGLIGKTLDIDNTELEPNFPSGFVLAQALLPLIANVSSESADSIAFLFESPSSTVQSKEEIDLFLEAVQDVVLGMGIVCPYLGSWIADPTLIFCTKHEAPKLIVHSNLGLDMEEIRKALSDGNIEVARSIYINGKYALDDGEPTALQHLSIHGNNIDMSDEPVFELFRQSNHGHHAYADAFVWQAFSADAAESSNMLASDTIVAMNVWMGTIHFMTQAVIGCHYEENQESVIFAIHQAAGLYIGDAISEEDNKPGNLLFGLADAMKKMFEGVGDNVPSAGVNTKMLTLFGIADRLVRTSNDACSGNSTTAPELNALLQDMTRQMTIPLVQGLVNALKTTDQDRVQLYARTIMPLISQCNDQDYRFFESDLIAGPLQVAHVEANIDRIYQVLPCLGLTCSDIGEHITDASARSAMASRPGCEAKKGKTTYSGYEPFDARDFEEVLRIDQDLREIQILLLGNSIEAASYIYQYGRHGTTSLKQLQETIVRSSMSFKNSAIQLFVSYYEDDDYIEKLVWEPLHNGSFMGETVSTNEERENLAIGFAQMVLLPHGALTSMQLAWAQCEAEEDIESIMRSWDHGAAYLLGSSSLTGSGRLSPLDLAETTCSSFETCQKGDGEGGWNNRLVELLDDGRGALHDNSCSLLPQIITELQSLLLVPVIQETLRASLSAKTMNRAFVASRAIVPLLAPKEAARLESLFPQSRETYDSTIPPEAMNLLSSALNDLGIDCKWIGKFNGMDACSNNNLERFHTSPSRLLPSAWAGIVLGTAVLIAAVVYCYCRSQGPRVSQFKRPAPSDDNEIDTSLFGRSFRHKTNAASFKAKRALNRISMYGDDSEPIFPVRKEHSNSSTRSGKTQGSPGAVWRLKSSASSTSSIFLEGNDDIL